MKSKQHILVGNWKMNPSTYETAAKLFSGTAKKAALSKKVTTIVCPPFVYLGRLDRKVQKRFFKGAQDVFYEEKGSFTGAISAAMLIDSGVSHVVVGHSESRKRGDTDEIVNKKLHAVLKTGLTAIVCIGEDARSDAGEHLTFLKNQIAATFRGLNKKHVGKIIIAYEPVWAIGADAAMQPQDVHETSLFIKKTLTELFRGTTLDAFALLYGGSVDPENAGALVSEGEVEGLLVGRQSLELASFGQIMKALDA